MRINTCFRWQETTDIPTVRLPPGIYGETVTLTLTEDIVVDDISITTCLKPGLFMRDVVLQYAINWENFKRQNVARVYRVIMSLLLDFPKYSWNIVFSSYFVLLFDFIC